MQKKLVTCYGRERLQVVPEVGLYVSFWGIKYVIIDVSSAVNKQGFPVSFQMKKEVRIEEFDNIIWTVNFTPSKHKDCYSFDNIGGECCDGWYD
jgi:hypothetical protein